MTNSTHFFLGANSGRGFQSLFPPFCAPERHYDLLVLKGGPGAGKSTMMKKIGAAMEEQGETVEYLFCSGDPDSLDGIHIPRIRTAIVDGTAPHVVEPKYPAAVERYVDMGVCYDIAAAKEDRKEIIHHSTACSAAYQRAFQALGAAKQMADSAAALVREGLDQDKLRRRGEGIISREVRGKGAGKSDEYRFLGSVTCRGPQWCFDSVEALCPRIYQLQDSYDLAAPLLEQIHTAARGRGYYAIVCPDAEHPERIHHLLLPELGVAFVTSREGMRYEGSAYRRIRIDAMVPPAHYRQFRSRLRFTMRMAAALRQEAVEALADAKAAHDSLEAVYQPHVDFTRADEITARELARIQSYL